MAEDLSPSFGTWKGLYHNSIALIANGRIEEVVHILNEKKVQEHFKALLKFNQQQTGSANRQEVQSGKVQFPEGDINIDNASIPQVIAIADALSVDEKYACVLFQQATEQRYRPGFEGLDLPTVASRLYYEERSYQLQLLCELLKVAQNENLIRMFLEQQVVIGALIQKLLETLRAHDQKRTSPTQTINITPLPSRPEHITEEMGLLSNSLFYSLYGFHTSINILILCLELLVEFTAKLRIKPGEDQTEFFVESPESIYDPALYHVCSSIFNGTVYILFKSDEAIPANVEQAITFNDLSPRKNNALRPDELLALEPTIMRFLDTYQPVSFHCGILFVYMVFLERNNSMQKCREVVAKLALALLNNPQAIDTVATVMSEDAMFFMAQMCRMKLSETGRDIYATIVGPLVTYFLKKSQYNRLYYPHTAKPRAFYAVFRFLASVLKVSPSCGNSFWTDFNSHTNNVKQLISHELFGEKIWLNLLELLANSVVNASTAHQAYVFFNHQRFSPNWDHIFKSMTAYINDFNPNLYTHGTATPTLGGPPARPLNPSDVRSWDNIFLYMTAVLEHNESIRGQMGDHPTWHAVASIFQFLMCPVPIALKARMLTTLAAFAKSEKLAALIWDFLDQSEFVVQSVNAAPIAGSSQTALIKRRDGIAFELVNTESVQQEYPLTRGLLKLISELIQWPLPTTLGVGRRVPSATGLQPYLSFICNDVFVKFSARGYTDLTEMWSIATECLSIMLSMLESYKYKEQDAMDCYVEVNGRKNLLPRPAGFLLIREISYGSELFKKIVYVIEQGAKTMGYDPAKGKDYLTQFDRAVELSLKVLISVFEHVTGPLAGLNLTLGQHLVSGPLPCAVSLAHLIGYHKDSIVPLLAVELLSCLTKTQYGLARLFYAHPESNAFLTAFANQLNNGEAEFGEDDVTSIEGITANKHRDNRTGSLKLVMARFLLENITREKPNVAQYYLGYISDFDQPDLASNPCLNAIVDRLIESGPEAFLSAEPQLAECYYELLYTLAADTDFCDSTMEFLRDTKDNFFHSQLETMPRDMPLTSVATVYEMNAKAWFFKLLAIEIMLMSENRSYVNEFLVLLFESLNRDADGGHEMMASHKVPTQRSILQFLNALDCAPPSMPATPAVHPQLVEATQTTNFRGTCITDLPALHDILVSERAARAAGANYLANNQLALVDAQAQINEEQEIFDILNYYRLKNLGDQLLNGQIFYFGAWKQLVEVALHTCSGFLLVEQRVNIAYELLETVLNLTSTNPNIAPFMYHMATLISTLMHHVRRNKSTAVSLSDYELSGQYNLPVPRLLKLFRMLLFTLSRPGSSRPVRGFLYSAVIDYLTITEVVPDTAKLQASQKPEHTVTWFLEDLNNHYKRMKQDNYETIREFGFGPFLDMVASDAAGTGGVDPWRAVSLALLDKILRYDDKTRADITRFLDERGYLRALIDFENTANGGIVHLLTTPGDPKAEELLYVGKLQLLQRIAQTVEGANLLWANFILEKIVNCVFVDYMPDEDSPSKQFIKERYMTLLIPFLDLCVALLLMLRRNKEFVGEFAVFLDKHAEVLAHLLRDRNSPLAQQLVTRMFYLLAEHEDVINAKLQNKQSRYHAHLLQLLHIFKIKDMWPCYGAPNSSNSEWFQVSLDVLNNVLNYCACLTFHGNTRIIFGPSMQIDAGQSALKGPIPPLSLLAIILNNVVEQHQALVAEIGVLRNHSQRVSDIPDIVLSEIDPDFALTLPDLTVDDREVQITDLLHSQIAAKDLLASKLLTVVEVVLSLLWQHLEHYLSSQATTGASSAQQQYYQQYYSPARQQQNLHQTPYQTLSSLHAQSQSQLQLQQSQQSTTQSLDPASIAQLRSDARSLLYPSSTSSSFSSFSSSRLPGNRPLLDLVSTLPANKKGNGVDVVVQKIKELIREPTPLINR